MIGNDIADLVLARSQSNWKRRGYLNKIFTDSEQHFIQNSKNKELTVWHLWSRKEAVYKIIIQKGGKRGYYPSKIECQDLNSEIGVVQFENDLFYTKTETNGQFIYSVAFENKYASEKVKSLSDITTVFKVDGIPFIKIGNKAVNISKTHHGRFEKSVYLQV